MGQMYLKDKPCRITLRLSEAQFAHVKNSADMLGVSPSEFLRMVVNLSMATSNKVDEIAGAAAESIKKGLAEGRANDKTSVDNLV